MSVPLLLSPEHEWLVESVARRVVELLEERERPREPGSLVDAATLARLFGVSRSTIFEYADRLGGVELAGKGKRTLIRFDVETARAAWTRRDKSETSLIEEPAPAGAVRRRRPSAARQTVGLLPVRKAG